MFIMRCEKQGCQVGLFQTKFQKSALFQVRWPKKFHMVFFWPRLKLVGPKQFIWPFGFFTVKKFPLLENIY